MAGRSRPRDLRDHACLGYLYLATGETWRFTDVNGAEESVTVKGPLSATNAEALGFALEAGCGVALQPDFVVWEAVREGRLETVLDDWSAPNAGAASDHSGRRAQADARCGAAGFPGATVHRGRRAMDRRPRSRA